MMEIVDEKNIVGQKPKSKLLVVDDREDNLLSIETILNKDGYIIKTANSGRAALKILLKEQDFTLILMDVQMPDLNGFETATLIYERDSLKHIPIIFITAQDHGEESVFKGYQMGGVDYIYKPINPGLLRAKVAVFAELYDKNHRLLAQEQRLITANQELENELKERIIFEEKINLLNQQLTENNTQLKLTNTELERFAYVTSHDLQEPLRKIMIFGDILANKYSSMLGDEGHSYLDRMVKSSRRMQMLIKNILAFSRATTNNEGFEDTDLNILLEGVLSDLEVYIEQKRVVFNIGELPNVRVIPNQFRQLLQNLIINAIKFSKENVDLCINIYAENVKGSDIQEANNDLRNDNYFRINIKDNGIGFDQKYAERIFIIFERLHSYDHFEGTGIGLSICKKIVEQHNGFISAKSVVNNGSTFSVAIPLLQPV
jgi:signal transduction histidine kinase